ncbi:hypothetical protein, partial [Inquilinus sp. CA228]|uniref:hypothetical protein n=1 Tax=Inquilinus sp. CA228 TaxID=3455609 RepID=UPI003F8D791E
MAEMTVEQLAVILEARMSQYQKAWDKALAKTDSAASRIEKRTRAMEQRIESTSRRAGAALGRIGSNVGGRLTGRAGVLGDALPELGRGGYVAAAGLGAAALGLTVFYRQGGQAGQLADAIGVAA